MRTALPSDAGMSHKGTTSFIGGSTKRFSEETFQCELCIYQKRKAEGKSCTKGWSCLEKLSEYV